MLNESIDDESITNKSIEAPNDTPKGKGSKSVFGSVFMYLIGCVVLFIIAFGIGYAIGKILEFFGI